MNSRSSSLTATTKRMSRSLIADTALAQLKSRDVDIESLSMSSVAAALGVSRPSLSRHVSGRPDLLRAVADRALETSIAIPASGTWREYLTGVAEWIWTTFGEYPGLAEIIGRRVWPPPEQLSLFALDRARYLVLKGFDVELALLAVDAVCQLAAETAVSLAHFSDDGRDWSLAFDPRSMDAVAPDMVAGYAARLGADPEAWIRRKLDVVLDGVAYRLEAAERPAAAD